MGKLKGAQHVLVQWDRRNGENGVWKQASVLGPSADSPGCWVIAVWEGPGEDDYFVTVRHPDLIRVVD